MDASHSRWLHRSHRKIRRASISFFWKREGCSFSQVPIFEKGYEKDPAIVAKEAIQEAARNHSDVVLVDTAGRMQVNPLLVRKMEVNPFWFPHFVDFLGRVNLAGQ